MNKKPLKHYLRLVYPIVTLKKGDEWVVWHAEFGRSAIMGYGMTRTAAVRMLNRERRFFIQHLYEHNVTIPEPETDLLEHYSGQFVLRIPKTLHAQLATEARADGVSLNQHLVHLLSERNTFHSVTKTLERIQLKQLQLARTFRSLFDDSGQLEREHHFRWRSHGDKSTAKLRILDGTERTDSMKDDRAPPLESQPTDEQVQNYAKAS